MEKNFIGALIRNGNKAKARTIFYSLMGRLTKHYNLPVNDILFRVFETVSPTLTFSVVRRGASNYVYPRRPPLARARSITISWIVKSALSRSERGIINKLEGEFHDLLGGKGRSLMKRNEFHKKAISNRFVLRNTENWIKQNYYHPTTGATLEQNKKFVDGFNLFLLLKNCIC